MTDKRITGVMIYYYFVCNDYTVSADFNTDECHDLLLLCL